MCPTSAWIGLTRAVTGLLRSGEHMYRYAPFCGGGTSADLHAIAHGLRP
jgi:hypothetical protein